MKHQEKTKKAPEKQLSQSMEDWIAALKTAAASREYAYQARLQYRISQEALTRQGRLAIIQNSLPQYFFTQLTTLPPTRGFLLQSCFGDVRLACKATSDAHDLLSGRHHWHPTSHARPTYCNVCREALSGVMSHGLSCEVCKCKVHKRCANKAISNCKWTTLASVGKDIIEDKDGTISMPHQWMEGNLPVSAKCAVCDKTCGSVLRLQDWRCLWCRATVHTACRPNYTEDCPLGPSRVSVVPPTALHSIGSDEAWEAVRPQGCSPLLVFVNSKSGDNQGVKFLRRFKQLLNPAQVFDLISTGPGLGLRLFRHFDPFRILVCSGDGSVGWVLSEIDRLNMQKQCQVGVLPLGTGNDLARVLGWGASCDDDTHLPQLLDKYEKASTKILDRWSIMTFERSISMGSTAKLILSDGVRSSQMEDTLPLSAVTAYEDSVVSHLTKILQSDEHSVIISSAKVLCETVKDFSMRAAETSLCQGDRDFSTKCQILKEKLDLLLQTLQDETFTFVPPKSQSQDVGEQEKCTQENPEKVEEKKTEEGTEDQKDVGEEEKCTQENPEKVEEKKTEEGTEGKKPRRTQLVLRANSLKRAVRQLVEHTERMVDEQNRQQTTTNTTSSSATTIKNMDSLRVSDTGLAQSPSLSRLTSISPLPDLRRDSACDDLNLESLPVPSEFADHRRGSATDDSSGTVDSGGRRTSLSRQMSIEVAIEVLPDPSSGEVESPISAKHFQRIQTPEMSLDDEQNLEPHDDQSFETHNGQNFEIAEIAESKDVVNEMKMEDQGILSGLRMSDELANIGHIDSSETSDDSPEGSTTVQKEALRKRSMSEDRAGIKGRRLGRPSITTQCQDDLMEAELDATNLISTSPEDEEEDDFRIELGLVPDDKKRCSIAHFVEGFDIARRSIKCRHRNIQQSNVSDPESTETNTTKHETKQFLDVPTIQIQSSDEDLDDTMEKEEEKPKSLLDVVKIQIQGSNNNLAASSDGMQYLGQTFDGVHRKSLALSETDDEELIRFQPLSKLEVSEGPTVVVNPPSPPLVDDKAEEDLDMPPFTYHYSRKVSAASPLSLLHCSPSPSRRISSVSLMRSDSTEQPSTPTDKRLPIINPLVRLPMWPNVTGGAGLISQVLLANADALCAPAVPLMDPDETLMEGYYEKCVMNNYFGIGIDAKISLDFHQKREEHPEKCRSRAKNYMWYGVLGSKEWLQKTYKNLEQRVQLECDGQRIPLPSLQGIVILNIPSFMGGTNFWGGTKEDDIFLAPSVDDRILEVVAVFGSVQMAASRLINLQHHRIAQCQTVQINILGDEGVPIQVDGEAWIQPPGVIRIIHKNRMKMLCRNRALESSLKTWQEKQRQQQLLPRRSITPQGLEFSAEETQLLLGFIEATATLIKCVKLLTLRHQSIKADLYELAVRCSDNLEKVHPGGKILQGVELRSLLTELVSTTRELHEESCVMLREKGPSLRIREDFENQLSSALANMESEFRKCSVAIATETGQTLVYLTQPSDAEDKKGGKGGRGLFWKFRREKGGGGSARAGREVASWGVAEVGVWLESLQLSEYIEAFSRHDVRGRELLTLTRRDLKDLGVTKVGHVKRILQAVRELAM